jgi:aspartokinase
VTQIEAIVLKLEAETDFITTGLRGNPKAIRQFIANLQIPSYQGFSKYFMQDVLSTIAKKYICHRYVIESLKTMELQDDYSQVKQEKLHREIKFEEEIQEIAVISQKDKIQLVEENMKHATKYKAKMYHQVDRFVEEVEVIVDPEQNTKKTVIQEKIYDSSYIIWVPYIQQQLKPWLRRFQERRRHS